MNRQAYIKLEKLTFTRIGSKTMKLVITALLSFALLAGNSEARGLRPRIIEGSDAKISDFPYQAAIRIGKAHLCGGSIISERHILTAAHCINILMIPPFNLGRVATGTSRSDDESSGHVHKIAGIRIHEGYDGYKKNSSVRHDIAILTIEDDIVFDEYQQKIELADHDVENGVEANLTGWGQSVIGPDDPPSLQLQRLTSSLLTSSKCQAYYPDFELHSDQLCAFRAKGAGACHGDSGGPLVADKRVVGIVSWVDGGNCASGTPEVYTSVYAHRDFIRSAMSTK